MQDRNSPGTHYKHNLLIPFIQGLVWGITCHIPGDTLWVGTLVGRTGIGYLLLPTVLRALRKPSAGPRTGERLSMWQLGRCPFLWKHPEPWGPSCRCPKLSHSQRPQGRSGQWW